ncbi:MAG TPA: Holliday junction resolvase RuvX [Casimicrobiaceae bacterium]|nr:Holliday junction resolvase RuvX [Casimicrobiaceae bacterium]
MRRPASGAASLVDSTVLAFDFGTRRIGVAVGDLATRLAHPLATIERERDADRFEAIAALVAEWRPSRLLVGLPVHADGTPHELTERARRFGRQLAGRTGLPVEYADERHTTLAAGALLAEAGVTGARAREVRDRVAAQAILQGWLDVR